MNAKELMRELELVCERGHGDVEMTIYELNAMNSRVALMGVEIIVHPDKTPRVEVIIHPEA